MKKLKTLSIAIGLMILLLSFKTSSEYFTYSIQSKIKQTPAKTKTGSGISHVTEIKIGNQTWTKKNLDVSKFRNGDLIPELITKEDWDNAANNSKPGWCYYKGDPKNGQKMGKLYNWYALSDSRNIAPTGWHVASSEEWKTLINFVGGDSIAGKILCLSVDPNNKKSGFKALLAGACGTFNQCSDLDQKGVWWTSTSSNKGSAVMYIIDERFKGIVGVDYPKSICLSVRCIKD